MRNAFLVLLFLAVLLLPAITTADHGVSVSVTIDMINGKRCFDGWPDEHFDTGCSKPDFFVRARFESSDGTQLFCFPSVPVQNFENIGGFALSCPGTIGLPFKLVLEVWDDDDHTGGTPLLAQQADLDPATQGLAAVIEGFRIGTGPTTISITGVDANVTFTASTTPVLSTISALGIVVPFANLGVAFDPNIAEIAHILGSVDDQTRVTLTVAPLVGGVPQQGFQLADFPTSGNFDITWDGRNGNTIVPNGYYRITARTTKGSTSFADVAIIHRDTGLIRVTGIEPNRRCGNVPCWSFGAGPIDVGYTTSSPLNVGLEVHGPSNQANVMNVLTCITLPIVRNIAPVLMNTGSGVISWDGLDDAGAPVNDGGYCFRVTNPKPTGTASYPGGGILILAAEPLRVIVKTDPAIPALFPTRPIRITATAMNPAGAARFTDTISISAGSFSLGSVATPAATFLTCRRATSCTGTIPATLQPAPTVSYSATAFDAGGARSTTVPLRLIDAMAAATGVAMRVNVATLTNADGTIIEQTHNKTLDVALFPGTGFDLTVPIEAILFDEAVNAELSAFLGFGSISTSVAENMGNFSFWVSSTPAAVAGNGFASICKVSWPLLSFAETQGALHRVGCRDSANGGVFSARVVIGLGASIAWHEFHHAGYGMADEYCCDGGYFEGNPANTYRSLGSCQVNSLQAATCLQIQCVCSPPPIGTCMGNCGVQTGVTSWWRSDPLPDVMDGNTNVEQADEARAAIAMFVRCQAGRC